MYTVVDRDLPDPWPPLDATRVELRGDVWFVYSEDEPSADFDISISEAEMLQRYVAAVQVHLDEWAQTYKYDGILSMASYALSEDPKFGPEGRTAVAWRTDCWETCYGILARYYSEGFLPSTPADLVNMLPLPPAVEYI